VFSARLGVPLLRPAAPELVARAEAGGGPG